jgi:hypothetical protein
VVDGHGVVSVIISLFPLERSNQALSIFCFEEKLMLLVFDNSTA